MSITGCPGGEPLTTASPRSADTSFMPTVSLTIHAIQLQRKLVTFRSSLLMLTKRVEK
jgi:hypothetical protein